MKTCIEPLGRIRRGHLVRQHAAHLIVKRLGIFRGLEIPIGLAPMGPTPGHSLEDLTGVSLATQHRLAIETDDRLPILIALRNSGLPKVLLGQYVNGKLRPCLRNVDLVELEYGGSVGIPNLRRTLHKRDPLVVILPATGKSSINFHGRPPERGKEL